MLTITTIDRVREIVRAWRFAGERIAFVPTMGNLHAGHLKLVEAAGKKGDKVVVSIFVNPTQFGVGEDYETYPRTVAEDTQRLAEARVDALFLPEVAEMYASDANTVVSVPALAGLHCGAFRPGHFDGVATVVCKLFNSVQPDLAFFGEKDFQQLAVIRMMVRDLNIPVSIQSVATVREADGLAMSSRNGYLTEAQRRTAPLLYQTLCRARDEILAAPREIVEIERRALNSLRQSGFEPDYFSTCRVGDLKPPGDADSELVLLAAARLGQTRLIDNVCFSR